MNIIMTVHFFTDMGQTYFNMNDYGEAQSYHKRALRMWQRLNSGDSLSTATSLNNMGVVSNTVFFYSNFILLIFIGFKKLREKNKKRKAYFICSDEKCEYL
jgi:hypothetical protein